MIHHPERVETRLLGGDGDLGELLEQLAVLDAREGEVRHLEPEACDLHERTFPRRARSVCWLLRCRSIALVDEQLTLHRARFTRTCATGNDRGPMRGKLWLVVGVAVGVAIGIGKLPYFAGAATSLTDTAERVVGSGGHTLIRDAATHGASLRVVNAVTAVLSVLVPGVTALLLVYAARTTLHLRAVIADPRRRPRRRRLFLPSPRDRDRGGRACFRGRGDSHRCHRAPCRRPSRRGGGAHRDLVPAPDPLEPQQPCERPGARPQPGVLPERRLALVVAGRRVGDRGASFCSGSSPDSALSAGPAGRFASALAAAETPPRSFPPTPGH